VQIRYRMTQYDDWYWHIDNFALSAIWGAPIDGLGEDTVDVTIINAPPTGGTGGLLPPIVGTTPELTPYTFAGYKISDPALFVPSESFAYRWDFDDGFGTAWTYLGPMTPRKVLIVHGLCYAAAGQPADSCADYMVIANAIRTNPEIQSVDSWNLFDKAGSNPSARNAAPSLSTMLGYGMIVYATNWGWIGNSNYDLSRIDLGDRLADFQDLTGRGVFTWAAGYDLYFAPYQTVWCILGRYADQDYGPFERANWPYAGGSLGTRYQPNHPVMQGVTSIQSPTGISGDYAVTIGGGGQATGRNGVLLADWGNGASAIGVKTLANGARSVHFGGLAYTTLAGDYVRFVANSVAWLFAPTTGPTIATFNHGWGDNGIYNVDFQILDDDMGWDLTTIPTTGFPTPLPGMVPTISHNYQPIEVLNVDPVITSVRATATGDLCVRVTGNPGNRVELEVFDGTTVHSLVLDRDGNNPEFGCLADVEIDVSALAGAYIKMKYTPEDDDGANPTWLVEGYFPGADPHKEKVVFNSKGGYQEINIGLGQMLLGVPITFRVNVGDVGSDNLGVVWDWGDNTPFGIQVHEVSDNSLLCGGSNTVLDTNFDGIPTIFDGCEDGVFERVDNSDRTPTFDPVSVADVQSHAFTERYLFYVMVLTPDDDNSEGYPSTFLTDGVDMEFIMIDLR